MKVARFDFGTGDFKEWFANNSETKSIKFVGTIPLDKIKETSEMIMNTGITSIDLSECEIATCCDDDTEEQNCDYYADEILDFNGHAISPLLKMFLNKRYSTQFVIKKGVVFSKDRKVIVYQEDEKTIKIPEGVEIIGRYAFSHYEKLAHIVLPDGLKEFGDNCMESLDNLHKLEMPDSVVKLGESSFCYSELESVKVADGIEVFPACCFRYCAIDNIPKSLRVIEDDNCFWLSGQEEAAVLELPEGFESLGSYSISSYDIGTIIFPSTTNFIAKDFWYDEIVGDDGDKPKIVISKDNPFYSVDKRNNIIYKYVPNDEIQIKFSRKAINFVESETERKYLLDNNVILSPTEMMNLVALSPERDEIRRGWFFNELYDTTILTEQERHKLKREIDYCNDVWHKFHYVSNNRFVIFGVTYNCVDEKTGKILGFKEERIGGDYGFSHNWDDELRKKNVLENYDKVVCRMYAGRAKKLGEELGFYEMCKYYNAINHVSYEVADIDRPYIDLPYPFEPGDIVKLPHYNEECVVSDIYRPTAEQIKTGFVDSYDMAVTVLPVKYAKKVRECISQNKPIPEKIREKHDHWSFLQMEMVEKFSEQK